MVEIVERRKCPHCGLWNEVIVDMNLGAPAVRIHVRGIVPKVKPSKSPGDEAHAAD